MPQQNNFDADAMLAFFTQLGKEVDNLKLKINSLNEAGGKGTNNLANEFERFGKIVEHYTRGPMKAMDQAAAGIAKTLLGAGGLAVGFAAVAKSLDVFAVGQLQLRNFATDTGFTVQSVQNLRTQLSAAGIDANEASGGIASIGSKLQEVLALQETSSFYKSLQASSPALAEQVRQLMNAGKQQEALNVLQQAYNNGGERFKAWLPTVTGMSRAAFEAGKVGMEGLIEPWKFQEGEAAKYHKTMTNLETIGTSLWTDMAYTMIDGINKMMGKEGIDGLNDRAHQFADNFRTFFNTYVMPALATTKQEFDWVVKAFSSVDQFLTKWTGMKKEGEPKDEKDKKVGLRTERAIIDSMNSQLPGGPEGGKAGGLWEWIEKQMSIGVQAAEVEPGSTLLVQETVDTDKDSNKLLRDMRDTFQKWDQKGGGAGGGIMFRPGVTGGGLGPYGSTGGMTFRPNISGGGRSRGGPGDSGGGAPGLDESSLEGKSGSDYLAARRAPIKEQIEQDPSLRKEVAAMMTLEHESDPAAVFESLANRTDYINSERAKQGKPPLSLRHMLEGGFYSTTGQFAARAAALERDPKRLDRMNKAMDFVLRGSNLLHGATDQGSGSDPNVWWQGGKIVRYGETYNDFGGGPGGHEGARRYREMLDRGLRAAGIGGTGTATVDIDFGDKNKPGSVWEKGASPFIPVNVHRSPQAAIAGGGVTAFNTYSFE
jgi:hypothetical protein